MFKRLNLFVAAVMGLALLVLAACGGGQSTPPRTPGNAVVRVTEKDDMSMKLDTTTVPAGKISFLVVNVGNVDHEVVLLKTDKAPNALIQSSATSKVDEAASGENVGEIEVGLGTTAAGTFDLTPGRYVLICNIAGHYHAGMFSAFTVTPTTAQPLAQAAATSQPAPTVKPATATGEQKEVTLIKAVRPNLTNTIDALQKGDIAGAKKAFAAYDAAWNGVEVYVNFRSPQLYADLETDLQAKIQTLLDAPQPNAAAIVPVVQAELAKWDEAITLVSTGPPISPLFDDVAALRMLRADTIRAAAPLLKAGDAATAKPMLTAFINRWPDVEDLIHERSTDAYAEIEGAMAKVNTAVQQAKPDARELGPLVNVLTDRYNYGLSLVNAAARGADPTKTTYSKEDVQSAADLATIAAELKASLPLWQNGNFQDAAGHAQRASGQLFANVSGALKAKNADAAPLKALNAYTALSDKPGDASQVSAANKQAVEAVAVAQQWVGGQFWTDPKFKDALSAALNAR